jgi:hypothetical protein
MSDDELHPTPRHANQLHGAPSALDAQPQPRRGTWRWVGRLTGLSIIGVAFGLAVIFLLRFADGPAVATTTAPQRPALKTAKVEAEGTALMSGPHVELAYPAKFDAAQHISSNPGTYESYILSSKGNYRRSLSVSVQPLPGGQLIENSSYRFRQLNTDQYRETTEQVGGERIAVMTKVDRQEQTFFWLHQGKLLTVAIVSSDPKDDVAAIAEVVKKGTRWRK